MSSRTPGPGKTAPKLLNDFFLFDPLCVIKNYRVLTDPAPLWEQDKPLPLLIDRKSCPHEYITYKIQSQLPELDERPKNGTIWKVATVCKKCRLHADITLDYRDSGNAICPNAHFPLHHFKLIDSSTRSPDSLDCRFSCTSWACQAALTISYTQPVLLPDGNLKLLINEDNLMRRYRAILEDEPERKDVTLTTPVDALYRLKRYTDDSLNPTHTKRQFPAHNKRFLGAFGQDCNQLLFSLGFLRTEAESGGGHIWHLPNPGLTTSIFHPDPLRARLENLSIELQILIDQICLRNAIPNPSPRDAWRDARPDIERLLSVQAYDRLPNRVLQPSEADHPCFGALGAVGDFSDPLIDFAYKRQTTTDPENIPYYFDCLQELAQGRNSEYLFVKTSEYSSEGTVGKRELEDAYSDIAATRDIKAANSIEERYLVDLYRATSADCGNEQRAKLRMSLQKIGQFRRSKMILNAASNTVETYDEALAYLGAEKDMGDEAIIALYGTKIGDSQDNSDTAQKAVQIIAQERKSVPLNGFINTGELGSYEMDLDEACKHLRITFDPNMDQGVLDTTFQFAQIDNAGQRTDQAIAAVRKAMQERNKHSNAWDEMSPVGLESHGNTCYLNSLLQYYFTIKPLRDLTLNIDQYKFDLDKHETKDERVQSIQLKRYEIEAYQKFADHLKHLFERMIKARSRTVRPDTELVCGAFLTPNESKVSEDTGLKKEPDDLIDFDMDGTDAGDKSQQIDATNKMAPRPVSSASSATLIDEDDRTAAQAPQVMPTPPASPQDEIVEPEAKPPLPPRPAADQGAEPVIERAKTQLELAEDAAKRQQDVAEVMEDLLRRLRAAIKPRGQDSHGEQLDQLRDLFNMRFAETIKSAGEYKRKEDEDATNILLNVPFEPTDIYSALDRVLDLRSDDVAGKPVEMYRSFTELPPLLQISIPRIALKDGQAVKVTHSLRLEETLYLDRYLDNPDVLEIRQQCWSTRKVLSSLQARKELIEKTAVKDINGPDMIEATGRYVEELVAANEEFEALGLSPLDIPTGLNTSLQEEAESLRAQLGPLEDAIRDAQESLKGRFDALTQQKYRLYAVFFHRGGARGGHYWTSMFDFENNIWRDYNDEKVDVHVDASDILNAQDYIHGTPTYAVYVRDDVKDEFVDPVCRSPEVEVTQGQADVQMANDSVEWTDSVIDDGSKEADGAWEPHQVGNITPQKRWSDSPPLGAGKRPAITVEKHRENMNNQDAFAFDSPDQGGWRVGDQEAQKADVGVGEKYQSRDNEWWHV